MFLLLIISLFACDSSKIDVGTENGVAYFHYSQNLPKIILSGETDKAVDNTDFFVKLRTAIDGKSAIDSVCNCEPLYVVRIDKYTFGLHTHGITVTYPAGRNIKAKIIFSVECSEEEMGEMIGILESE